MPAGGRLPLAAGGCSGAAICRVAAAHRAPVPLPLRPLLLQISLAIVIPIIVSTKLSPDGSCLLNTSGNTCL